MAIGCRCYAFGNFRNRDTGSFALLWATRVVVRRRRRALVVLLTLENLGTNITALVTGLGIGGVAVALALQNVLGDLLASLSITLDEPFVTGDFIASGTDMGTVEYIGIKSTRLRSLDGEQIVMPNSELLKHPLRNYGRMNDRRVVFTIGVRFETVYHVPTADFDRHVDLQQSVFLVVHEALERLSVGLAYPARRVWLANPDGPAPSEAV